MTKHAMFVVSVLILLVSSAASLGGQTNPAGVQDDRVLTLVRAVEQGLARDPRTRAAHSQHEAAAANVRVVSASRLPSVFAEAGATRFQEPMIVAPLHRFDPTAPPRFASTLFQSRWTAAYTLFDGGARGASIRGATAKTAVATAAIDAMELTVIQDVANAFLSVVAARELWSAEQRRLESLQQEKARVQQLFDVGRAARVALLRADAAIASALASNIATEQRLAAALNELSRLLALPPNSLDNTSLTAVTVDDTASLDISVLVSRAIEVNPGVSMARHDVELTRATERGTRSSWLPTVQLAAGVVTYAGSGVALTGEWQGGISVTYPIFTGGARVHRIAGAVAAREAAEASVQAREQEVAIGIERSVAMVLESRARVAALSAAVTYADEVARIERLALSAGAGVQSDFLRAEADLYAARADLVSATQAEVTALIKLAATTGELSIPWLRATVENTQ